MTDRPIILFPSPEKADRDKKNSGSSKIHYPDFKTQYDHFSPKFESLYQLLQQKNIMIQQSPVGMNPDFALVFETIGPVNNLYKAVKASQELEWMFDLDSAPVEPDDDFYVVEKGVRKDSHLNTKLYCIMSNQTAIQQLLSMWKRYSEGDESAFQRGFAPFRHVFAQLKEIRKWNASDRIAESHILEYWQEAIDLETSEESIPFEVELFYRNNAKARFLASQAVTNEVKKMGGSVLSECIMNEICYHALLVKLPRRNILELINHYLEIQLVQIDDIMFFRPVCQSAYVSPTDTEKLNTFINEQHLPTGSPIAAILDGMPIQNHPLLRGRIIVDDPDSYEEQYEATNRIHGTAMASLAIFGDLNKHDSPVSSPIYMRPIMRPQVVGPDEVEERIPADEMLVDLIHRAIKRIVEGDNGDKAVAPSVKIINLSIADPVRQLAGVMSPLARLIDYLSYKYKLLFVISAGNHGEILECINQNFTELETCSISERNAIFWNAITENQRNLRVLSPAESINAVTIGALYDDFCNISERTHQIWAVDRGLPSPISAIGRGYRSTINPDLFYYGGRKFIYNRGNQIHWLNTSREPGCKVAAPYKDSGLGCSYTFGTSDAAAQITHEALKCHDVLQQVFINEGYTNIPSEYIGIFLKAMLAHGASWVNVMGELSRVTGNDKKYLSQWIGNGVPDIERVKQCTKDRITLIGYGNLKKGDADVFHIPLPVDFTAKVIKRKLTVTLSYFSPIVANKQSYRAAQLWFSVNDGNTGLICKSGSRINSDWQSVRRGTLQHEIFECDKPIVWNNDDLTIKVNCAEDAGMLNSEPIPYCVLVSFEVAEGLDVDLYSTVSTLIRQKIPITSIS